MTIKQHKTKYKLSLQVKFETNSDPEQVSDQEQLDIDILLNMESDNKWMDSPPQVYSVTPSKFSTAADLPIEM